MTTRRQFLGGAAAASLALGTEACIPLPGLTTEPTPDPTPEPTPEPGTPCAVTPDNIEGPFWREEAPWRADLNVHGATGTALAIVGRVLTPDCEPLADAVVDVWHCAPGGDYDNESAEFAYRGRARTDTAGNYGFATLMPGRYLNGDEFRPAHVHFKVSASGHAALTTQLYFEGDPFNDIDGFIRDALIREAVDDGFGGLRIEFDVVLEAIC